MKKTVIVTQQVSFPQEHVLVSIGGFKLNESSPVHLSPVNLTTGKDFQVDWITKGGWADAHIMSHQQFTDYQNTGSLSGYEAHGYAKGDFPISYNISLPGMLRF